jgi:hypothetical protein
MAERMARQRRRTSADTAENGDDPRRGPRVLVLSGGAPHAGLLAGALCAVYRRGKTFDMIWASGGGALMALLLVAHKTTRRTPCADAALRDVVDFGVSESIYRFFPVGYKTFFKVGPFTRPLRAVAEAIKRDTTPRPFPDEPHVPYASEGEGRRRLFNDLVDFCASALTPTTFPFSSGLCEPLPFLEDKISFEKANLPLPPSGLQPKTGSWFYVNAYNLQTHKIEQFTNGNLSPEKIRAALAFPLIYPVQTVNGAPYCEGADVDPINLPCLDIELTRHNPGARVYVLDILGSLEEEIIRPPRSAWGAFGLSLVVPVVSLAEKCLRLWDPGYLKARDDAKAAGEPTFVTPNKSNSVRYVRFDIPPAQRGRVLEWSHENACALFDAGFATGQKFMDKYGWELPRRRDLKECPRAATGP